MDSPITYVLTPVAAGIAMNGIVFGMGWNKSSNKDKLLPPGYIIGSIWVCIFALLGFVAYLVRKQKTAFFSVALLLLFCLAYPFLTNGLRVENARVLNLMTLIISFVTLVSVVLANKKAGLYMIPLLMWATYVNIVDAI